MYNGEVISSGTLRDTDIVSAILGFAEAENLKEVVTLCEEFFEERAIDETADMLNFIVDDIFEAMQEHADIGCIFGFSEGDGALLGYWQVVDDDELLTW